MELNIFHKIVLAFAFLILGIGLFNSVSKSIVANYSDIATVTSKYDLISLEPISEEPTLLSSAWLKNMMVSSMIDASDSAKNQNTTEVIVKIENPKPGQNLYLLKFPEEKRQVEIIKDLQQSKSVAYAEPNYDLELQTLESQDTLTESIVQSSVSAQAQIANPTISTEGFKVAIIDSGVDRTHVRFKNNKIVAKTYLNDLSDKVGHGTHLAGLILSIAPNAEIYSYKFTDGKVGKLSGVLKAMADARKDGVDLVNLSLGLPSNSSALQESVQLLQEDEIIVVAAAGNQNTDSEFYPAAYPGVYSVGALTSNADKFVSSNYGNWVTHSTIGQDLYSTAPKNSFKYLSGTSQSAAVISGLIAQYYLSENPNQLPLDKYLDLKTTEKEDKFSNLLGKRILLQQ